MAFLGLLINGPGVRVPPGDHLEGKTLSRQSKTKPSKSTV